MAQSDSYPLDLRAKVRAAGSSPDDALEFLRRLTSDPNRTNPVQVVQLGLGALQLRDPAWLPAVAAVVAWIEETMDEHGLLPYRFAMPHTFPLGPPWHSALAQGEAASLLVRAGMALGRDDLPELAGRAIASLLDSRSELVVVTPEGPVLQEYPTEPPAHVLNGWITALWGLHDVASSPRDNQSDVAAAAGASFEAGIGALAARLRRYRTPIGWSRYDLYPHPFTNVASVFYHRLHVVQLRTLHEIAPRVVFSETARDWDRSASSVLARSVAISRKVAFRLVRPRSRRVDR
jgi:heparosan-N-sulfate-glucuronate 5-epimerase